MFIDYIKDHPFIRSYHDHRYALEVDGSAQNHPGGAHPAASAAACVPHAVAVAVAAACRPGGGVAHAAAGCPGG